jgi:hypothetical protein
VAVGAECPSHKIKIATPPDIRKGSGESFFRAGRVEKKEAPVATGTSLMLAGNLIIFTADLLPLAEY